MERTAGELRLGAYENGLYLHIPVQANYAICPTARQILMDYISAAAPAVRVVVDLFGCQGIDSTFAGWLLGLRAQLTSRGGQLVLSRCSERCHAALEKLGLTRLLTFEDIPPPAQTRAITCFGGDKADRHTLQLMIEAHEDLAAVNPGNSEVFRTVVEMLKRQLQKLPGA